MILVTGGTGFIGSYILRMLVAQGHQVRALKRSTSSMCLVEDIADKVEWVDGDILNIGSLEDAFSGVTHVYHAAAIISFHSSELELMKAINVEGTANIVNLCLDFNVKKLLHVSSVAAIGRSETSDDISEATKWKQSKLNSNYGKSKFKAECEVWRGIEEGLSAVIVNPSVVLGSGIWKNGSCQLFSRVERGLNYYPVGVTGFVDVRDVAKASIQLMESEVSGERFLLSGENLSFKEFISTTAKYLEKPLPKTRVSKQILGLLWRLEWLKSKITRSKPLLTRETANNSSHQNQYDGTKILDFIPFTYTPIEVTIQETCKQVIACRSNGASFGGVMSLS